MVAGLPPILRRLPLTLTYLAALTIVGTLFSSVGSHWQAIIVAKASTNLHNLGQWHLSTLATSAFVIDEGPVWFTCLGVGCTLAVAELAWGGRRVLTTFLCGHLGATAAVAVGLWVGISSGILPVSWETASDVGVSYGVVAVLSGLAFSLPRGWRLPWAAVWIALAAQSVLSERSFTSVGHCIAVVLGLGVAGWAVRRRGAVPTPLTRSPLTIGLLVGATGFGLCIVGWGSPGWWSAPLVAAVVLAATKVRPTQTGLLPLSCGPRPPDGSPTAPAATAAVAAPAPTRRRARV